MVVILLNLWDNLNVELFKNHTELKNFIMRHALNPQLTLGQTDPSNIELDPHSRDDIPQLLRALQNLFNSEEDRKVVLSLLQEVIPEEVDPQLGRPGMDLWSILVLGTLRLGLNADYDRIMELANEHKTLRKMLGHGLVDEDKQYGLQTIRDNVSLVTPEILDLINWVVVQNGHEAQGKEGTPLSGRCDSSVVKTDVHYPTDTNLLIDAMRKVIYGCGKAQARYEVITGWRQYQYNYQCIKNLERKAQKLRRSNSKDPEKIAAREALICQTHQSLLDLSNQLLDRAKGTLKTLYALPTDPFTFCSIHEIEHYMSHAERQIDQIYRRVIKGEVIPHDEKVFSIFEEHTEWINKGKAGVPVELGLRVSVLEDNLGFILHHKVMEQQTDDKVTVAMIRETQARYPNLRVCSFDKGYYSPDNRDKLEPLLDLVVLPKKGKWSEADRARETEEAFVDARKQHSAVESAINALQVHGMDRCLDQGIEGFKRYVAWAVVSRNLLKLGAILRDQERERLMREAEREKRIAA